MSDHPARPDAHTLIDTMRRTMPALVGMGVTVETFSAGEVVLRAPLPANANDKGTGFAGSLSAIGMLAGWAMTQQLAEQAVGAAETAIHTGEMVFHTPVRGDIIARCARPQPADIDRFTRTLTRRGKARLQLRVDVGSDSLATAMRLDASYAAWQIG